MKKIYKSLRHKIIISTISHDIKIFNSIEFKVIFRRIKKY